jgi:hypothetical protein
MTDAQLKRLDGLSVAALLLWAGAALGFAALAAPTLFRMLPRDLAASVAGGLVGGLDLAALAAFGLPLFLTGGGRWLSEIEDAFPIGPLRLWTATAFMALLLSGLSGFIVSPRIRDIRAAHQGLVSNLPEEHVDRRALARNHKLSTQAFVIRILLAVGLAWGVAHLPVRKAG